MSSIRPSNIPPPFPHYTSKWHTESYPSISPTRPELSAAGKTVLVTGGGTGIGAQVALSFAAAGASVIGLIARREDRLQTSAAAITTAYPNTKVVYAIADILDAPALQAGFAKVAAAGNGKIDILVSNAGYLPAKSDILDAEPKEWWKGFEINVLGTFNAARAFQHVVSSSPVFLNITSAAGTIAPIPQRSAYTASKIANAKIVEHLADEIKSMRVVNIQPGVVHSEMNDTTSKEAPFPAFDTIELPGDFCVWLASPEAGFLHGKFVWVNWDVDELKAKAAEIQSNPRLLTLELDGLKYA